MSRGWYRGLHALAVRARVDGWLLVHIVAPHRPRHGPETRRVQRRGTDFRQRDGSRVGGRRSRESGTSRRARGGHPKSADAGPRVGTVPARVHGVGNLRMDALWLVRAVPRLVAA